MSASTLVMALLLGVTGSLHCAGMCGAIMYILPFQLFRGWKRMAAMALYHGGRITVYALMAVVLHSFRSLFEPRVQQYISVTLGALLMVAGLLSFVPMGRLKMTLPWAEAVQKHLGAFIGKPGLGSMAAAGTLNGLLPCGLVYMALSATFSLPGAGQAAVFMYAFGVGTLPALVAITMLRQRLNLLRSRQLKKMVPVMVFVFGCLFMLRGMNLGIPYVSPKVVVSGHQIHSCCHKK